MPEKTLAAAQGSRAKLFASLSNTSKKAGTPTLTPFRDTIMRLQRAIGNRAMGRALRSGVLQARLQAAGSSGGQGQKSDPAIIGAAPFLSWAQGRTRAVIMRHPGLEFYCHDPKKLSDRHLLKEIQKIKKGLLQGMCINKTETEQGYREELELEADNRGLLTRPTGIAGTRLHSSRQYGAAFTHKLSISRGGLAADLLGTQVKETLRIDRDDFRLPKARPARWILGKMKASTKADEFTDTVETGKYGVEQATSTKRFGRLPPVRKETQRLYWRRYGTHRWQWFATVKIYFKVEKCGRRTSRYCAATSDNGVVVRQLYHGVPPRGR